MTEKYLDLPDVENVGRGDQIVSVHEVTKFTESKPPVTLVNATITWPAPPADDSDDDDDDSPNYGTRTPATGGRTPYRKFMLMDLTVEFPLGELTLICGPLGSGKTLLLLGKVNSHPVFAASANKSSLQAF